jgi:DNA-binding transcriptional MerR regulator
MDHTQIDQNGPAHRLAYGAGETCWLLGNISRRTLRRLEQRGLLKPSVGLRHKLYLHSDLLAYLEATK